MALTTRCALLHAGGHDQPDLLAAKPRFTTAKACEVRVPSLLALTLRATACTVVRCEPAACFTHPRRSALRQVCALISLGSIVLIGAPPDPVPRAPRAPPDPVPLAPRNLTQRRAAPHRSHPLPCDVLPRSAAAARPHEIGTVGRGVDAIEAAVPLMQVRRYRPRACRLKRASPRPSQHDCPGGSRALAVLRRV